MNVIKKIADFVIEPLAFIINLCFEQGIFPTCFKKAVVTPLHKKGDTNEVSNYRPVSILSSFSKIFELLINNSLMSFFLQNNLFNVSQHGFMKNKSLDTALAEFMHFVTDAIDKKMCCLGFFIDFSKAFDCVNHYVFLKKLERYGVRGVAHRWFQSYLEGRSQIVKVNRSVSEETAMTIGVPQGSILGPTLFVIFINDLLMYVQDHTDLQTAYADDNNYLFKSKQIDEVKNKAQILYHKLCHWVKKNKLCINNEKTTSLIFTSKTRCFEADTLVLENKNIQTVSAVKLLGLNIDCQLKWVTHIDNLCNKLSKVCFALRSISTQCNPETVRQLYFGAFHNILKYGVVHWGLSSSADRVFKIQKWAIRILSDLKCRQTCKLAFRTLNILTLPGLYIYETVCFAFKNMLTLTSSREAHNYPTRHRHLLLPESHSTMLFQKGLHFNSCKFFNGLPEDIRCIKNITTFKAKVKKLLIMKCCYTVDEFFLSS